MSAEQLPLLSHGLPPLQLGQRVRVTAEQYEGWVAQLGPPYDAGGVVRAWYAVYSVPWRGHFSEALPAYERHELEAVE